MSTKRNPRQARKDIADFIFRNKIDTAQYCGPVRQVTRDSTPELATRQAVAVSMLRKYEKLYRDRKGEKTARGDLTHLLYEANRRALTCKESEHVIAEIKKLKECK